MSKQIDAPLVNEEQLSQSEKDAITCAIFRACKLGEPAETNGLANLDDWSASSAAQRIMSTVARISSSGTLDSVQLHITPDESADVNLLPDVNLVGSNVIPFERSRVRKTPG